MFQSEDYVLLFVYFYFFIFFFVIFVLFVFFFFFFQAEDGIRDWSVTGVQTCALPISLGLVLYQLIIGDFTRPLTMDWGRGVTDPLLREDLGRCFAGEPQERFGRAAELAKNLQDIENRRAIQVAEALRVEERKKRAYLLGLLRSTASVFLVIALLATLVYLIRDVQAGQYGSIEIKTFPSGAEVWLNGSRMGITPYQATRLRPGEFSYSL